MGEKNLVTYRSNPQALNDLHIRPAKKADAKTMARLWMLAMGEVMLTFIGTEDEDKATGILEYFIAQPQNQYSYENCWVAEVNGSMIGAVNFYDGSKFDMLQKPIVQYVNSQFNPSFKPERETQAGEIYIDSIAVFPEYQGRGHGRQILQALIEKCVIENNQTLGLLVDCANPNAKKLYTSLGFKKAGQKSILGFEMEHLQLTPRDV